MSRSAIIRLILFLMFIGALVLKTYYDRVQIWRNLKIVEGSFSGFSGGGRNQPLYFDFIFFFKGLEFKASTEVKGNLKKTSIYRQILRGSAIPIAIDSTSPDNALVLLYPKTFELIKSAFPDSLSKYCEPLDFKNCKNKYNSK